MAYQAQNPNGQAVMTSSEPVVIASNQSAVPVSGPLTDTQLRATAVPISGTVTANAGTGVLAVSGPLTDTQLRATAVPVSGTVTANAGTGTLAVSGPLTDVQLRATAVPVSGTVTANAGTGTLAISAASLPLPSGAATAAKQPALGTAGTPSTDVISIQGVASGTGIPISGTVTANAGTGTLAVSLASVPSHAVTNAGTFATQATLQAGTAEIGKLAAGLANIGDVDVLTLPALVAGTANIGDVDILTIAAGDNNIGNVDVLTLPALIAGTANIGDVDVLTLPNVILAAGTNTNEIVGDVAHDIAIAGNPVRIAGRGVSADYTAVATGDTTDLITDLTGKQIVLPYSIPENFVNGVATLTGTGDVAVIAAGGVGIRNYVTSISASNTSATNVRVDFKDGITIIASFFVAANGGGATHIMPIPIRGTAATAFNAALSAAVTDVRVSAQGYRGI